MTASIVLGIVVIFAVIPVVAKWVVTDPKLSLSAIADPTGLTEADFVRALNRQPTAISTLTAGRLLQWQGNGQHLAVLFDHQHRYVTTTHRHLI